MKIEAQDKIIAAICIEAFKAEENKELKLANEIRKIGTKLAKSWGLKEVSGLPNTWNTKESWRGYKGR